MPKKYDIADFKMSVEFTCPKCMKRIKQEVELNPINSKFSWYENPCEMCGSHGNLCLTILESAPTASWCGRQSQSINSN